MNSNINNNNTQPPIWGRNRNNNNTIPAGNWRSHKDTPKDTTAGGINPPVSRREGVILGIFDSHSPSRPTIPLPPPPMKSATAWSYDSEMSNRNRTSIPSTPPPLPHVRSNRRRNNNIITTQAQAPIKKNEFVYDMMDFPSLVFVPDSHVIPDIENGINANTLSYAKIAAIIPIPSQKSILPRNLNDDFEITVNENENEEWYDDYDYESKYQTINTNHKWDDDEYYDLESGSGYH